MLSGQTGNYSMVMTARVNNVRNWMAVTAVIITYIVQIYSNGIGTKFGVANVAIIVVVALLVGAITYGGVTICVRALQSSQKK